ncbi:hypothetical protein [Aeromicrobium ginsengisoli]|nr:hypothetical protein [Aeromicrobium ginsengisoli]
MTIDPSDPIRRQEPDMDPGLAPDPEHEVEENPPEGDRPAEPD